jgi:type IV secretion system protein VirB4
MDNIIQVLSGRNDTVALLDRVIDEHGEDPKDWLPIFYQKAQKLL